MKSVCFVAYFAQCLAASRLKQMGQEYAVVLLAGCETNVDSHYYEVLLFPIVSPE